MARIAIEEHWNLPELSEAVRALPAERGDPSLVLDESGDNLALLEDLAEARLRVMDAQSVDLQVLSLAPPGTQPLDPAQAVPLARRANDLAVEAVRRHPRRFRALATLPMPDPAAAVAELERAAGLGMVGAMVYGRSGDVPLDDPRNDDVLAAAASLGMPVFVHPQVPPLAVREASYGGFDELTGLAMATFGWGWHLEAALAALRLVVRGTFERHPDLQLVLGHWGELLPFWLDRADSLARVAGLGRSVSDCIRTNVHLTSSGMLNPALLRHVLEVTTPDRLLFSTDYPFQRPDADAVATFLTSYTETAGDAGRDAFFEHNARALFGIEGEIG